MAATDSLSMRLRRLVRSKMAHWPHTSSCTEVPHTVRCIFAAFGMLSASALSNELVSSCSLDGGAGLV